MQFTAVMVNAQADALTVLGGVAIPVLVPNAGNAAPATINLLAKADI